jgi:hypothetical protein
MRAPSSQRHPRALQQLCDISAKFLQNERFAAAPTPNIRCVPTHARRHRLHASLSALTLTSLAVATNAVAADRWRAPVDAPVSRAFDLGADPFEAGRHRGADFAAAPGATVRAPCAGRVAVAGRVGTSGRVVTIRCGALRATVMPLERVAVRAGATIRRGASLGSVAPSSAHAGLHLGARRDGDRFGYVDPLRLIGRVPRTGPPPVAPRDERRRPPPSAPAVGLAQPNRVLSMAPARSPSTTPPAEHIAPWPAWAGLAALLAGAFGTGMRLRIRSRRAAAPRAAAEAVP